MWDETAASKSTGANLRGLLFHAFNFLCFFNLSMWKPHVYLMFRNCKATVCPRNRMYHVVASSYATRFAHNAIHTLQHTLQPVQDVHLARYVYQGTAWL
jgi:hypothetical protein